MFDVLETDIMIMQETKIQRKDLKDDMVLVPGWDVYFSLPKHKKGTATCIRGRETRADSSQVTQGWLFTHGTQSAHLSEQKKAS